MTELFFDTADVLDISEGVEGPEVHKVDVVGQKVSGLVIGALVFLATFTWIDLVQTAVQIYIMKNPQDFNPVSGSSEGEEEEEIVFAAGWKPSGEVRAENRGKVSGKNMSETAEKKARFEANENNKKLLLSKSISAFVVTFIAIIGIYVLSYPNVPFMKKEKKKQK